MDPRRLLSVTALPAATTVLFGGCSLAPAAVSGVSPLAAGPDSAILAVTPASSVAPTETGTSVDITSIRAEEGVPAGSAPPPANPAPVPAARPYLGAARSRQPLQEPTPVPPPSSASGRSAIAAANRQARAASSADAFVGGVQIFAWDPGRDFEVWTAPLRVTSLTLAPGETVTAKAAGDTVRWQIGESTSGEGATARTHVLIKPLQAGLETNLILTTNQRIYLLTLRSGGAEAFNAAISWDYGASALTDRARSDVAVLAEVLPPGDVAAVTPQGPLDARYRIQARGRPPRWAPTAVFNDGVRTFIALSPDVSVDESPALFVLTGGDAHLVNYRQVDGLLIVDRVFDEAELRLGDHRPQIVRIRRIPGGSR